MKKIKSVIKFLYQFIHTQVCSHTWDQPKTSSRHLIRFLFHRLINFFFQDILNGDHTKQDTDKT